METNIILDFSNRLDKLYISNEKSELIEFIGTTQINRLQKSDVYAFLGEGQGKESLRVVDIFSKAVYIARTDSLNSSLSHFRSANKELEFLAGNPYLFSRLFYNSGWSFYFYLKGVYAKASAYTIEGLALSEHLEAKGGAFLGFRRVLDQLPNLSKILIKQGNIEDGYSLYNGILRSLIYKDFAHLPGKWNKKMFDHDEYFRQQGIDNVVINAVKLILGTSRREEEQVLFDILFRGIGFFDISNDHLVVIERFILLKRTFFAGDTKGFLAKLEEFLALRMDTYFDVLKLSLIGNYLAISQNYLKNEFAFSEVCAKVDNYISSHLHLQLSERFLIPVLYKEFPQLNQHNQSVYV